MTQMRDTERLKNARIVALEAKLAEAKAALEEIAGHGDDDCAPAQCYLPMIGVARSALRSLREETE
jgi:hypothetical protein